MNLIKKIRKEFKGPNMVKKLIDGYIYQLLLP